MVVAGGTALIALRDTVRLTDGERVLVRGAAGGVGTAAVQLAHAMGGHVTCDRHATALHDLGADKVLDYATTTSDQIGPFDIIVDTVGTELHCYRSRLAKGGRMVTVGLSGPVLAAIATSTIHGSRRSRTFSANPDTAVLDDLAGHVTSGALRPVVTQRLPTDRHHRRTPSIRARRRHRQTCTRRLPLTHRTRIPTRRTTSSQHPHMPQGRAMATRAHAEGGRQPLRGESTSPDLLACVARAWSCEIGWGRRMPCGRTA